MDISYIIYNIVAVLLLATLVYMMTPSLAYRTAKNAFIENQGHDKLHWLRYTATKRQVTHQTIWKNAMNDKTFTESDFVLLKNSLAKLPKAPSPVEMILPTIATPYDTGLMESKNAGEIAVSKLYVISAVEFGVRAGNQVWKKSIVDVASADAVAICKLLNSNNIFISGFATYLNLKCNFDSKFSLSVGHITGYWNSGSGTDYASLNLLLDAIKSNHPEGAFYITKPAPNDKYSPDFMKVRGSGIGGQEAIVSKCLNNALRKKGDMKWVVKAEVEVSSPNRF